MAKKVIGIYAEGHRGLIANRINMNAAEALEDYYRSHLKPRGYIRVGMSKGVLKVKRKGKSGTLFHSYFARPS